MNTNSTTDSNFVGVDTALVARLFAWADVLGLIAIVVIAGSLVIAGARCTPKALAMKNPNSGSKARSTSPGA